MKPRTLGILTLSTVGVLAAAWYARDQRVQSASGASLPGTLVPELRAKINDVQTIEIKKGKESLSLSRQGADWTLANRAGYPVEFEKVKQVIMAASNLKVLEAKTKLPEQHAKLGLQDPTAEGSEATQLTLKDSTGALLADLIVGKTNYSGKPTVFVRKSNDPQCYQCEGELHPEAASNAWIKRDILKLDRERVRSVDVRHPDGETLRIFREKKEDADFQVADIPPLRELSSPSVAGGLGSALTWVSIDDVAPATEVDFASLPATSATFRTFDGLVVKVETLDKDGKSYGRFSASFEEPPAPATSAPAESAPATPAVGKLKTPDEVKKEAADYEKQWSGWAFVLPSYKATGINKRMTDMLKALPAPESAPAGEESAPASQAEHEH